MGFYMKMALPIWRNIQAVQLLARLDYEYCIIMAMGENSNTSSSLLSFGLLMCHKANEERRTLNGHHVPLMKQPPKSSTTTVVEEEEDEKKSASEGSMNAPAAVSAKIMLLETKINFVFVQAEEEAWEEHLEKATYDETLNKEELQ